MTKILNIAAYKFATLPDLRSLRAQLLAHCRAWDLKGTILLSVEGINLFVAGEREKINLLLAELRAIPGLADLSPKFSETEHQPFSRMLVRVKKEIIAFGVAGINPAQRTSPKLSARELKQWLDEGRPVTLLDTRNDYEVKLGTFKNALPIGVDHFRDFPAAVAKLPAQLKEQPIVMFCTGGIRCEKAGPFMESVGFQKIFQLDGGILKYFEECGGAHYDGECFVFDQRVGLDPSLQETDSTQCFRCQTPLSADDQKDARYVPGQSCPFCFKTPAEQMAENIAQRHAMIAKIISPMPGSVPYDNFKPVNVPESCDGKSLLETMRQICPHVPVSYWEQELAHGLMLDANVRGEKFMPTGSAKSLPLPGPLPLGAGEPFVALSENPRRDWPETPTNSDGQRQLPPSPSGRGIEGEGERAGLSRHTDVDANAKLQPVAAGKIVRAGERYLHLFPNVTEPDVNGRVEILHEDEALIVLHKPAPLPMHAGGRFFRNTLQHILNAAYHPQKPHPAHRLDANTTGVLLVTRTRHFAGKLQPQFARGEVKKSYLVRVNGVPTTENFFCDAPISDESSKLGARLVDLENGLESRTEFSVRKKFPDGTTLLEARPLTGRTNQIRIHCAHLGFPVCGDPAYLADGKFGDAQTLPPDAAPLCLHSWKIYFAHPQTQSPMTFTAPPPAWADGFEDKQIAQSVLDCGG